MTTRNLTGDCRVEMRKLEAKSINCCVCSPPYWGLRDYGIPPSIWGGDPQCKHKFPKGGFCRCGAWRGCFGLEPTYQLYLEHIVEIFAEVWRVLRDDGTLWINMGDCYATRPAGWSSKRYMDEERDDRTFRDKPFSTIGSLKPKDLVMMPARVAIALQEAGWWLRRDIIWHKLNPMPESVYDRPTTSHEYLFQFSKSGSTLCWRHANGRWVWEKPEPDHRWRHRVTRDVVSVEPKNMKQWFRFNLWRGFDYYYDFAAIMEPSSPDSHARAARSRAPEHKHSKGSDLSGKPHGIAIGSPVAGRYPQPAGWSEADGHHGSVHPDGRRIGIGHNARNRKGAPNGAGHRGRGRPDAEGMERWNAPGPNSRVKVDRVPVSRKLASHDNPEGPRVKQNDSFDKALGTAHLVPMRNKRSVWSIATKPFKEAHFATFPPKLIEPCILAGCPKGGVVLDPFGGAGTTGLVAELLGRNAVLIELNPEYAAMAEARIAKLRMGTEEKKRHDTKTSGKLKPASGLPLFPKLKPVTRDSAKEPA